MQRVDSINLRDQVHGSRARRAEVAQDIQPRGKYHVEHWREGKLIAIYDFKNGITNVGKNYLLGTGFHAEAQIATWYIGLINNAGFTALAATDTMAAHAGWTETTSYNEATRVEWTEGVPAAQSITNVVAVTFTMNASLTVNGIFLNSVNTKGGATGTLWSTGSFAAPVPVVNLDELKVTYTLNA